MSDGTPPPYTPKVDRRTALIWVGAVGAAAAAGAAGLYAFRNHAPEAVESGQAEGYGTDPKLNPPIKAPWPRLMSQEELQTAALLADYILPASGAAPAASAIGVPDFMNEWVSSPYPGQEKDRPVIRDGLKALAPKVLNADAAARQQAMGALAGAPDEATRTFFNRFRALTIGAYYTTEAGFKDIGYIGNEPRATDPGPSDEVKQVVDQRLKAMGL